LIFYFYNRIKPKFTIIDSHEKSYGVRQIPVLENTIIVSMKSSSRQCFAVMAMFFTTLCFSQNCDDIGDWMNTIKNEYPNMLIGTAMPRGAVENMAINLYSDKFYKPHWGKSFGSSGKNGRTKSWRKIQTCYAKQSFNTDPYKAWIFQSIVYNYHIDFRSDAFIKKVATRNQLRAELETKFNALKRNDLDAAEMVQLKTDLSTTYTVLFPSELDAITKALIKSEANSAENQLLSDFEGIKTLPLEYLSIEKVLGFKSKNAALFAKLSKVQQDKLSSQLNSKIEDILVVLMPKQMTELKTISSSTSDISKINTLLADFKNKFRSVMKFDEVQSTLKALQTKKTEMVSQILPEVATAIAKSKSQRETSGLYQRFVTDLVPESSIKVQLEDKIEQQRQFLFKEEARLAQENTLSKQRERLAYLATEGKEEGDMRLDTQNMYYAEFFDYLYRGHIENIDIKKESAEFLTIFNAYITAFSRNCQEALPEDKVELMELVCDEYTVTTEVLSGIELYRNCTGWVYRGSGIFVKPELYKAKQLLEKPFEKSMLAHLANIYGNPDATGNAVNVMHRLKRLKIDMDLFFDNHDCKGKAMAQFEANLLKYATGKPLQRLKGVSIYEKMRITGAPTGKQDFKRLLEDMVRQQSVTWTLNKYIPNTITNLKSFVGQDGKTIVAYRADYKFYNTFLGNDTGKVTVRLKEGLPDCIIFSDFPNNCKKPSASLLVAYCNGDYRL